MSIVHSFMVARSWVWSHLLGFFPETGTPGRAGGETAQQSLGWHSPDDACMATGSRRAPHRCTLAEWSAAWVYSPWWPARARSDAWRSGEGMCS